MTTPTTQLMRALARPFPPNQMHWRVGNTNAKQLGCKPWEATKGMALAYIDARNVMQRLDDIQEKQGVFWQSEYLPVHTKVVICRIGLMFDPVGWVWRSNGAGETQVEGEKGAASDAFKRAAVCWGIGRYLYSMKSPWADLEKGRLAKNFTPQIPEWATPEGYDKVMEDRDA